MKTFKNNTEDIEKMSDAMGLAGLEYMQSIRGKMLAEGKPNVPDATLGTLQLVQAAVLLNASATCERLDALLEQAERNERLMNALLQEQGRGVHQRDVITSRLNDLLAQGHKAEIHRHGIMTQLQKMAEGQGS